ncbi:uncharacterized protein (DUF697 family) [Rhizomicrobium palustre]|uniref:Uncharacterized protein (DUF697 family) n=1 Tax=Rhizomicrobium palustre TaxID=189966 RepID=A0A846MUF4_9PROT|nr:DUF697 domain-containing protein [Rhizomicrobium palustre]NIK87138.1 uncharacterized protein (DUF697 family) [Rhizomicrobium palustre]
MSEKISKKPSDSAKESSVDPAARAARVETLSRNHILMAMGVSLVPLPVVDILGAMAIQLDLIKRLSAEYDLEFKEERGKAILTSLLGGIAPMAAGEAIASLLKFVPLVGSTFSVAMMPVVFGASTYAVGKVFAQHYEAGGTILDFDAAKMKKVFLEEFCSGKRVAANLSGKKEAAG